MALKEKLIIYSFQDKGRTMQHKATQGNTNFFLEADEAVRRNHDPEPFLSFLRARQGRAWEAVPNWLIGLMSADSGM